MCSCCIYILLPYRLPGVGMALFVSIAFSISPSTKFRLQGDLLSSSRITLIVIPSIQFLPPRHGAARIPKTHKHHHHHHPDPIFSPDVSNSPWSDKGFLFFTAPARRSSSSVVQGSHQTLQELTPEKKRRVGCIQNPSLSLSCSLLRFTLPLSGCSPVLSFSTSSC